MPARDAVIREVIEPKRQQGQSFGFVLISCMVHAVAHRDFTWTYPFVVVSQSERYSMAQLLHAWLQGSAVWYIDQLWEFPQREGCHALM